ncbi:MAG: M24 family metallopeptidase [Phycisphaerales bacterium]
MSRGRAAGGGAVEPIERAGHAAAGALQRAVELLTPGMAPRALASTVLGILGGHGAAPVLASVRDASSGAFGWPLCVSVNEIAVNGVPSERVLEVGDLVTVDVACEVAGWHADAAATAVVGGVTDPVAEASRFVLEAVLEAIRPGLLLATLHEDYLAACRAAEVFPVREAVVHGIGRSLHEPPFLLGGEAHPADAVLVEGMVLAVEPVVAPEPVRLVTEADGWSRRAVSISGGLPVRCAYEERTVVVEATGVRNLTPVPRFG